MEPVHQVCHIFPQYTESFKAISILFYITRIGADAQIPIIGTWDDHFSNAKEETEDAAKTGTDDAAFLQVGNNADRPGDSFTSDFNRR